MRLRNFSRYKIKVKKSVTNVVHKAHHSAHLGYFGFVAFESHGIYGSFAAACLVLMVFEGITKDDEG